MPRTAALAAVAAIALAAARASAQPDPEAATGASPAPAAPAPATAEPSIPEVDDAMLAPVPPARRTLRSWRQALRMVRARSTALRSARAKVEQAAAQSRQALAAALPALTGTANVNHHLLKGTGITFGSTGLTTGSIPDPATTWNAGLSLRQPVFAPGAWHDHGTARQATEAARLSEKDTERAVLGAVADTIVAVVTAERVAEISRVSLRSALSTTQLTRTRARLGAASAVDVLRAEQEVALSRAQIVSADESVRKTREALGLALGHAEAWGVAPHVRLDHLAGDAESTCRRETSVASRPDVRAAAANLEVARRNVESVDWRFSPTLDLVSNLNYVSEDRFSPNGKHVTWTVGAQLVWPLYDGGLRYGSREASESEVRIASEGLTETKRQARVEVRQAERSIQVAQANLAVSRRSRQIAKESARLARVAFVNGSGTSFDLVDAARRLREADLDLAIKEFEVVRAQVAALLALATCDV